jgi:transposase-like protein
MKKKRYSNEEIAGIVEVGASTNKSVEAFCREHGVHPQACYGWKMKFGGMSGD